MEGNRMVPLEEAQTKGLHIMEPEGVLRHLLMEPINSLYHGMMILWCRRPEKETMLKEWGK